MLNRFSCVPPTDRFLRVDLAQFWYWQTRYWSYLRKAKWLLANRWSEMCGTESNMDFLKEEATEMLAEAEYANWMVEFNVRMAVQGFRKNLPSEPKE